MQTAVEWFFRWVNDNTEATHKEYAEAFEQSKEMEKQQIIDAAKWGYLHCPPEQYYNETYESKGSDELSKVPKNTSFDTSSQTEISDEEIWQVGDMYANQNPINDDDDLAYFKGQLSGFFEGAKWYREQLKSRQ